MADKDQGDRNLSDDRIIAECRAGMEAMATAFVTRDPGALRYLSGQITAGPTLPASQFMLSAANLIDNVLTSGQGTALGRDPTDAEVIRAWRLCESEVRQRSRAALDQLAEEQIRAGLPGDEVRSTIENSASVTDAGLATALPILTAFITGNEEEFQRMMAEAAREKKLGQAVRATPFIIRDLFESAMLAAYGRRTTDAETQNEWEQFMLQRAAEPGP
jgi:hypothetical protein